MKKNIGLFLTILIFMGIGCVKNTLLDSSQSPMSKLGRINRALLRNDYQIAYLMLSEFETRGNLKDNNKNILPYIQYDKAYCLIKQKKYYSAIEELDRAINIAPKNVTNYVMKAYCYSKILDIKKAISDLKTADSISPRDPDIKYNLGCIYMEDKDFNLAIREFKQALEINPDLKDGYINLGYCFFYTGKYKDGACNIICVNPFVA